MGKKRIVLDTNIIISAFGWDGKPRGILREILNKEFDLIISKKQLEEIFKVLGYPKFKFTDSQKSKFINILIEISIIVNTYNKINIIKDDPYDNNILESAAKNNVDYLISGDKDLLRLKNINNIRILTASEFLELIKK